jgi:hypothetical protein
MARKSKSTSKSSPDQLVKTSTEGQVELTEDELKRVTGGDTARVTIKFTSTTKDKVETYLES